MKHVPPPTGEPVEAPELFAALGAAVHPAWHQAILRLANASERIAAQLEEWNGARLDRRVAPQARELIEDLIHFLDTLDPDPDLEPSLAIYSSYREADADECEVSEDAEPSLGSFDRMTDQTKSWRQAGLWVVPSVDAEQDDCDREDDDPDEAKQQAPEMCPCA